MRNEAGEEEGAETSESAVWSTSVFRTSDVDRGRASNAAMAVANFAVVSKQIRILIDGHLDNFVLV